MNIYVAQIYIEAGVNYPFSHLFQVFFGKELTKRINPSGIFIKKYASDFDLMFRMSAKEHLKEPEIKGPTVFKKDKDVEYTIFLTFNKLKTPGPVLYRQVLRQLIDQIVIVLTDLEIDTSKLLADSSDIIETVVTEPKMFRFD
ncbi:hypothetical protein [Gimesia sp.]|uniref:hypothetical protein n=1 Tax=Gimesia sp. TaxID=2024833 RepID=UPI000C61CA15|nr:hypothetical protein [Gimesia sp.]MAX36366.1 hypothetical protein [Gimesia sp.]HAH46549.1 hypothetical protein [Planctomycetaceae bacterium]HBL45086.1 hypothetical protein [Planctomycetaceae bacterium]|tara:strand:- start:328 stop:756 length:429 start_codon:yes stop_codon:yes gene_type:complete